MGSRTALGIALSSAWIAFSLSTTACGPRAQGGDDDGSTGDDGAGGQIDAPRSIDGAPGIDSAIAYPDAMAYDDGGTCNTWQCASPVDDGCNPPGVETCNDGSDEDCDGQVDEGCSCSSGAVQSCFHGPPGRRGVGSCVDGMQTCQGSGEFAFWGPCTGGITPNPEACDTQDNDCNGCADDNPACCTVDLACPGPGSMPDGLPFQPYVINGSGFYSGTVTSWAWTVTGGPCDQLFVSEGHNPTFTLAGQNTNTLTMTPTLSGDYTVTVVMTLPDSTTRTCTFIVHIGGPGVRVELCWDTTGQTDIDLHLHKPNSTARYWNSTDDCYYGNCYPNSFNAPNWGYANTPQAQCPPGVWPAAGCKNPRLDVDNISIVAKPENINVDDPPNGATFRVMVHFYGGSSVATHPIVNVYCGGFLKATYGAVPDQVPNFNTPGGYDAGLMWRVVDITPTVSGGVTTDCALAQLHPPAMPTAFYITNNNDAY